MPYNLGTAYIEVVPSVRGLGKAIEDPLAKSGDKASKGLSGALFGGLKVAALGAGGAIAGTLGASLVKGFGRLTAIENAEAKLRGLGHSATDVQSIMDSALKSVKGTAFGLDEAAGLAGTLVASGIKPGEELQKTLSLVGDSATIAGRGLGDMGLIWGSVAAKGKLQGDDAMQLLASGVPIWQMVGDVMGVTAAEAQDLGKKGQVSFDIFRQAMEKGVGGAALESGNTTQGAFKNMGAALSRFGASVLKGVFPLIGPAFGKLTEWIDLATGAVGPFVESMSSAFGSWLTSTAIPALKDFSGALKGVWDILVNGDFTGGIFGLEEDSPFIGFLFTARDAALGFYEKALVPLGKFISDHLVPILAGLGGFLASLGISAIISAITAAIGPAIAAAGGLGAAIVVALGAINWIPLAIGAAVAGITWFFTETEAGQAIFSAAWGAIQSIVGGVVDWFTTTAWPLLVQGWHVLSAVVSEVVPLVWGYLQTLGSYWQQIVVGVVIPAIMQFAGYIRDTVAPIVMRLWTDYVQPALTAIGALAVWLWESALKPALTAIFDFVQNVLAPAIVWLWQNVVSPAFSAIGAVVSWVWNSVIFPALDALKWFITNALAPVIGWLWTNVFAPAFEGIKTAVVVAIAIVTTVIQGLIWLWQNVLAPALGWLWHNVFEPVWQGIQLAISAVVNWFRDTAWPVISTVIDSVKLGFERLRDGIGAAWKFIQDNIISPVASWFRDTIGPLFSTVTDGIGRAFDTMKDAVGKAWDAVKEKARTPVDFVINKVYNEGLRDNFNTVAEKLNIDTRLPKMAMPAGFARGGILPGFSRMRDGDDQLVAARRGEGWMVSEGLRDAASRSLFLAANAAARRGVPFSQFMGGGYARGGIVSGAGDKLKDLAGDAIDGIKGAWDVVSDAIADPKGTFKKLVESLLGSLPDAGIISDIAKHVPVALATSMGDKLFGGMASAVDASGAAIPAAGGPIGSGGSLAAAEALSRQFGLVVTSRGRRGAVTAGGGLVSLHALGRALDLAGPASQMMAYFNAARSRFAPTELLYSPAGALQKNRSSGYHDTSGATKRNHYSHVHIGFAGGGIVPRLYDQGGRLDPGVQMVVNRTRKPETILPPAESRALTQIAAQRSDGVQGDTFIGYGYTPEELARAWRREDRKRAALHPA